MRLLLRILVLVVLIAAFAGGAWWIMQTPPAGKKDRPAASTPQVEVIPLQAGEQALRLFAYGRVEARNPLDLRPEVEGRILQLHPAFEPGGLIRSGEQLAKIDDAEYQLALEAAESSLEKARARLAIEGGRRQVAREELRLLADSVALDESSRSLALRAPQLQEARADVLAARNQVAQARLQLQRTHIDAPEDVVVLQRDRSAGELINRGERIGRLASASRAQVILQFDPGLLARLDFGPRGESGARVEIRHQGTSYLGRLRHLQQQLSERTRQAEALVEIEDPFNLEPDNTDRPPLLIGSYVEAWIDAGSLPHAIVIPRAQMLDNRRVWVVDAGERLQIREVRPLFEEPDRILAEPLPAGDRLLRGNPAGLLPGTTVSTVDPA